LRDQGTEIRNEPFAVAHMLPKELDAWIARVDKWSTEAIEALGFVSAADAKWLATLRNVPPPTIPIPNIKLGGTAERDRYIKAFREHDCRLDRFEKLCTKHGVGV
jgi:hypothetical protein